MHPLAAHNHREQARNGPRSSTYPFSKLKIHVVMGQITTKEKIRFIPKPTKPFSPCINFPCNEPLWLKYVGKEENKESNVNLRSYLRAHFRNLSYSASKEPNALFQLVLTWFIQEIQWLQISCFNVWNHTILFGGLHYLMKRRPLGLW